MYDWLTSKTAVIVAAIVILGVMAGFFLVKNAEHEEASLDQEARGLARYLNDITSRNAEFTVHFTFFRDSAGYELLPSVNGDDYEITISTYQVVLSQDGRDFTAPLIEPVHGYYPPSGTTLGPDDLYRADLLVKNFTITSGQDFYVQSRMYLMPGKEYAAFCYTDEAPQELEKLNEIAEWIRAFNTFDMTNISQLEALDQRTVDIDLRIAEGVLSAGGNQVAFADAGHLFKPLFNGSVNRSEMNSTDLQNRLLFIPAGGTLVLERRRLGYDGETVGGVPSESVELFFYSGGGGP